MSHTKQSVKLSFLNHRLLRHAAVVVLASSLVAVAGPFGTSNLDMGVRFLYWLGSISIGWIQWSLIVWSLHRLTSTNPWPPGVSGTVAGFVFAGLMALEINLVRELLFGIPGRTGATPFLVILGFMLAYCWFGQLLVWLVSVGSPATSEEFDGSIDVRFLKRIPHRIAGDLLCLRTEDHYLRIYTTAGDDLILFRLKDAVSELAGFDGMQVHRSYWVARDAVTKPDKKGRKTTLFLKNGLNVPVSESFLPSVREAGWLE